MYGCGYGFWLQKALGVSVWMMLPTILKMVQTFLSGEYEYALAAWDNQVIQA